MDGTFSGQVSVIGTSAPDESIREKAYTVGRLLGESNAVLVCGGGPGVMAEACEGMSEVSGGLSVGILKEASHDGNEHLDLVLPTGMGHGRNLPNVLAGEAVIAVGGRWGTLSEIAFARIHDRPVFGVDTWDHSRFDFPADLSPSEAVKRATDVLTPTGD